MNVVGVACMRRMFITGTWDSPVEGVKDHHGTVHTGRELQREERCLYQECLHILYRRPRIV